MKCPYKWSAPHQMPDGSEKSTKQTCSLSRGHHGPHRSLANVVSEGFLLQEQPECAHTPKPRMGYIEHAEWAAKMLKTHRQERCPVCGLWAIWTPKETKAHV